jgi:hypothetical protein
MGEDGDPVGSQRRALGSVLEGGRAAGDESGGEKNCEDSADDSEGCRLLKVVDEAIETFWRRLVAVHVEGLKHWLQGTNGRRWKLKEEVDWSRECS